MSQKSNVSLPAVLPKLLRYAPTVVGLCVIAALGILYFKTRAAVHTFDAVSYMWNIEVKPLGELFAKWKKQCEDFREARKPYLLY